METNKVITLPKDEHIHIVKDGKRITLCTMRQKALHVVGLDNGRGKIYTRHGRRFCRPYRNYFAATKKGDKDLDALSDSGYMEREVINSGTEREYVLYSFNRTGLDWLGNQLGIYIFNEDK